MQMEAIMFKISWLEDVLDDIQINQNEKVASVCPGQDRLPENCWEDKNFSHSTEFLKDSYSYKRFTRFLLGFFILFSELVFRYNFVVILKLNKTYLDLRMYGNFILPIEQKTLIIAKKHDKV